MHCLEKLSYSAACPVAQFSPLLVGMWSCTYRMIVGQHIWITVKCLASIVLYKFSILYEFVMEARYELSSSRETTPGCPA